MKQRLLGAMVLAVGLLVGVVGAADDKSKSPNIPTISEVMQKVNGKAGLQKSVGKALTSDMLDWDDIQKKTKEMVEHVEALGKNMPEKGAKESWEKLTKSWLESAKKVDEAAKKKDKERAAEEDRTTEWIEPNVRKMGVIIEAFEQRFLHVPGDGVERKKSALVPRFPRQVWDVRVSEIEDGVKAREVVHSRQQTENDRDDQESNENRPTLPKTGQEIGQAARIDIGGRAPQKIKVKGQREHELGAIANRERKKCSGQKRARPNQQKIERCHFSEQREAERELPGSAESQVAPRPRPKDGKEREQDSSGERLAANVG